MRITDSIRGFPGCCNITGRHDGPFLDTGTAVQFTGPFRPSVRLVAQMAEAIGWRPPADGEETSRDGRIAELERQIRVLEAQVAEDDEFRRAVGITLRDGAVVRHGSIALRERPKRQGFRVIGGGDEG